MKQVRFPRSAHTAVSFALTLVILLAYADGLRLAISFYALASLWCAIELFGMVRIRSFVLCAFGCALWAVFTLGWMVVSAESLSFSGMLTQQEFTEFNNTASLNVLGASACLFCAVARANGPSLVWRWLPPTPREQSFARFLSLRCLVAGTILAELTSVGDYLFNASYAGALTGDALVQSGGVAMAALMLLSFGAVAAARGYGVRNVKFAVISFILVLVILITRFLKGDRGGTLVVIGALLVLWYMSSNLRPIARTTVALLAISALLVIFQLLGEIRYYVAEYGVANSLSDSASTADFGRWSDVDLLRIQLVPAAYWHMLNVVGLSDAGTQLGARRFFDLLPMAIPETFASWLGYARPETGAWLLASYRVNSGGLFVLAEAFWAIGIFGAMGLTAAMALISCAIERFLRRNEPVVAMAYIPLVGAAGFAIFYGLQPFARALEMSLFAAVALSKLYRRTKSQ